MERKICGTAIVLLITLVWASLACACGPYIHEKYLSFFSAQFIDYAPLHNDLRVRRYAQKKEREAPKPYYLENQSVSANLREWQDYLKTKNIQEKFSLPVLAYLIYQLDRDTLATISGQTKTLDKRSIAQLADAHDTASSMRDVVRMIREIAANAPEVIDYLLFMKHSHESGIILFVEFESTDKTTDHPLNDIDEPGRSWDEPAQADSAGEECEKFTLETEPDDVSTNSAMVDELLAQGRAAYERVDSEWLKVRYAYQMITLARYAGQYEKGVALYDELVEPLRPKSRIRYWALDQKAGALYELGQRKDAEILFHEVYAHAPERRASVRDSLLMLDVKISEEPPNTPHDIARMWAAKGLDSSRMSLQPMRRVYEFAPRSGFLESLLIWTLLKWEEKNFARFLEYPDYFTLDIVFLKEFQQFALNAARKGNVSRPALWYLTAGYLAFMQSCVDERLSSEANSLLKKAERSAGTDILIQCQARLLRHVVKLYQPGRISKGFRESLYPELQWLADQDETAILQSVMTILAQKLLIQGDVPQAICCLYAANNTMIYPDAEPEHRHAMANFALDMYATAEDVEKLSAFMNQRRYSAFERFLLLNFPLSRDNVLDVWGTHLLRQHKFKQALRVFERISPDYWVQDDSCLDSWETTWEGWDDEKICTKRFRTSFFDNARHSADRFFDTNKREFTNAILQLEREARRGRDRAGECCRQIANAFYNTPYWGYSAVLWKGSLVYMYKYVYGADYRDGIEFPFNAAPLKAAMLRREKDFGAVYGTQIFAMEYYRKALRASKDENFTEEILGMMRQCVERPTTATISRRTEFLSQNKFYREMTRYKQSSAYRELLKECPIFQDYMRQHSITTGD